jgi:YtkA-like protein
MGQNRLPECVVGLLLLVGNFAANGCARSASSPDETEFSCEISPATPHLGANTFTVTLRDKAGAPRTGARLAIEGDMTHPGMRPAFADSAEIAPGKYQGSLDLSMAGDWTILFHITLANGQTVERQLQIRSLRAK